MLEVSNAAGLVIDDKEQGLFRIHRSAFTDPAILALEKERLFDRSWQFAGHVSEVPNPGDFVTRNVGGRPVIIVRGDDDEVRVLLNTCRHRGNLVCRDAVGKGAEVLRCFYHGWVFSTRGELVGIPGAESYSEAFDRNALGLEPVPRMTNYRGCLFVSYFADIEPFETALSGAKEVLDNTLDYSEDLELVQGTQLYCMRANWKLLIENSIDGYHAAFTHERYFANFLVDMEVMQPTDMASLRPGGAVTVRPMGNGTATSPPQAVVNRRGPNYMAKIAGDKIDAHLKSLEQRFSPEKALKVEGGSGNYLIFPNLIVIDGWHTFRTFYPISPDYMEITAWALFPKNDDAELRNARLQNFLSFLGPGGFATPDDVEALEGCQMGFATHKEVEWSDISRGMKMDAPTFYEEMQMRAFWREWYARMTTGQHVASVGDK